jgi:CheY-like chemotaxis protein
MIILAVDDDPEDREFFCDAIEQIDTSIVVMTARNGSEALQLLQNNYLLPDHIFLDINMPMMDGKTCLQELRKEKKFRDIPVVMYSTTKNQSEINLFKSLGARFLIKPDEFEKLVRSLAYILGYSRESTNLIFSLI